MSTMREMVDGVKAHAVKHYEKGGWDYVVECWSDTDIEAVLQQVHPTPPDTVEEAIKHIGESVKVMDDYRQDIVAAGGGDGLDHDPPVDLLPEEPYEP